MEEIIAQIYNIFRIALVISLLMLITKGIVREKAKKTQGIVLLIVSSSLFIIFLFAFIYDNYINKGNQAFFYDIQYYIYFLAVIFIYMVLSLIMLIKNHHYVPAKKIKKKMVYTYHNKEEYVYAFYRYKQNIYLLHDTNCGIKYKMKKMEFADDVVKKINQSMGANLDEEIERSGMITVKGQNADDVYYCYMIDLNQELSSNMLEEVNSADLPNLIIPSLDRFIILTCLTKYNFTEEY